MNVAYMVAKTTSPKSTREGLREEACLFFFFFSEIQFISNAVLISYVQHTAIQL